jgi:hypothetical protein
LIPPPASAVVVPESVRVVVPESVRVVVPESVRVVVPPSLGAVTTSLPPVGPASVLVPPPAVGEEQAAREREISA